MLNIILNESFSDYMGGLNSKISFILDKVAESYNKQMNLMPEKCVPFLQEFLSLSNRIVKGIVTDSKKQLSKVCGPM